MTSGAETPQKKPTEPITPVTQSVPAFPTVSTPIAQIHGVYPRRPSLIDARTACSSSSSLYELNVSASNLAGAPADQHADSFSHVNSSLMQSSSSENESDTELDIDMIHSRQSHDLFKNDWREVMGTQSPTFNGDAKQKEGYLTQLYHIDSSTPIFKRLISKNTLKPQLKAFRRISTDLLHESVPLENEINHEKLVLLNLKDEELLLTHGGLSDVSKTSEDEQNSAASKFDIIKRANESWNQKKNAQGQGVTKSVDPIERDEEDQGRLVRKRSSFENDPFEFRDNSKRRAVSTSPISSGFLRRGSIKLISKTSKDLEKMTLKK